MSEQSFKDGEVVWVKWASCWWPGEVWDKDRVPEDIFASLRKPVIVFVKFFQEESFEFVRSHNNIMKYDCPKKLDFIKKGMEKFKTSKVMSNFPDSVVKAEELTNGNVNILKTLETPTKQKASSSFATPDKSITESSPVISKKSTGAYNSASKMQCTPSPASKPDKLFTCTLCPYSTERINLLMIHIKNHSSTMPPKTCEPSPVLVKRTPVKSPAKRAIKEDTIADDVRKIKESLKEPKPTPVKKTRGPAKSTPTTSRSRASKKEEKVAVKEEVKKVEETPKSAPINELKNELLADWDDDDDDDFTNEKVKIEVAATPPPKPSPQPEKAGESSRSIRNIPKKQRVSEVYVKQETIKIEPLKAKPVAPKEVLKETQDDVSSPDVLKKNQKSNNRKYLTSEVVSELEPKKVFEEEPVEDLLVATAELLNETEVPKVENAQLLSTFHKSNDIEKRNLPPKERNKRIRRASKNNLEPSAMTAEEKVADKNGSVAKDSEPVVITSPIQNELMLPHKKKQSSRLLSPEKPSLIREGRRQEVPTPEARARKKRKSSEPKPMEIEANSHENLEVTTEKVALSEVVQSPLRLLALEVNNVVEAAPPVVPSESNFNSSPRRGQKRRNSKDSHLFALTLSELDACSMPKKLHTEELPVPSQPKTIVACASETICISSKGQLSVARKDNSVTTQANTVMVTSQVIISEATRPPIVSSSSSVDVVTTPKPQISSPMKIPHQALKKAVKMPAEDLLEMKKQGLVTVGTDNKNKFTEKGMQIFKQMKEKTVEAALIVEQEKVAPEPERTKSPVLPAPPIQNDGPKVVEEPAVQEKVEKVEEPVEDRVVEPKEETSPVIQDTSVKESNGSSVKEIVSAESTNNNDIEKEPIVAAPDFTSKESLEEPIENGKDGETEQDAPAEDPNSGGAGLIALQAETFGGPANCFYLCRAVDDRYEPVDNQILVLNAQNALVPYEGDVATEDALVPNESATENLAGYPQLSPNSNIIINTPNGQKIELNHYAILALQEQADENGIASIELSGEQLELNINGILEAISQQQEANESEALIPGSMLIDSENALILDSTELPVEMHHSATQVSETLSKPIMSTTIAPEINSTKVAVVDSICSKNLNIEDSLATIGVTSGATRSNIPKSLELPITITNPTIAETVNHRKLANATVLAEVAIEPESFVVQSADNGSQD